MSKEINIKVLDLLYHSVVSEGGDGDGVWLSKHTTLDTLIELVKTYNTENNTAWSVESKGNYLLWGENQEWVIITSDEEFFKKQAEWIILKINY